MPDDDESPAAEIDGYAVGAVACAAASFLVPVVLAVAALFLARAYEVRRDAAAATALDQAGDHAGEATGDQADDHADKSRSDTLVWIARVGAWANIALVVGVTVFFLIGIAARVAA